MWKWMLLASFLLAPVAFGLCAWQLPLEEPTRNVIVLGVGGLAGFASACLFLAGLVGAAVGASPGNRPQPLR